MITRPLPAPVGGWNASQALEAMPPGDAVRMTNWLPKETHVELRKGSLKVNETSTDEPIETLVTYRAEDGTEQLIAGYDGKLATVNTSTGAFTSKGTGYTNDQWQTVMFNDYMLFVNGADAPQQYDGTTLGNYSATITGATPADLKGVMVFKGRAIYWENNAAKFWYAAAGSYGGALTSFPLSYTTKQGGYVVECCTWSRDSGAGADDLFVVIMSTGETLVYEGSDPGSAFDFQLVGSFQLGKPLAIRGSCQLAADRIIITEDGFVNLSTALQVGRATEKGNVSSKIITAAKEATQKYKNNYGWEVLYYDDQSLLIVNIPRFNSASVPANNNYEQFCMNTNTGAWTQFRDWNAITFTEYDGNLYMGGSDGHVRQAFTGTNDDGNSILGVVIPAFTGFDMPDRGKQLTYVTVITDYVNKENIGIAGLADFEERAFGNAAIPDQLSGTAAEWDTAEWDVAPWSDINSESIQKYDMPVWSFGYTLSCKMRIYTGIQTPKLYSFKFKFKAARSI